MKNVPDFKEIARGAVEIIGMERVIEKLKKGETIRVKHGFDATAPDLHLGHTVPYTVLRRFQDLGATIILLAGDFTTSIGDPTDRDASRPELDDITIQKNITTCLSQIAKVLDVSKLEIHRNSEWYGKMNLHTFLNIARNISATRLWERDMFQKRLEHQGVVWTHELLYPILQGYDSVILDADLTVIGNDQTFNELMGRELQTKYGQKPQGIIAMPILPGTDGVRKMGKSFGNYIGIQEKAQEQYGKIMSISDSLLFTYFELLSSQTRDEIKNMKQDVEEKKINPRDLKMNLAQELVTLYHGKREAQRAQEEFVRIFQKKEKPEKIPTHKVSQKNWEITELLVEVKLASSKTDARRLIEQKGISLNDLLVSDIQQSVIIPSQGIVIKRGKRKFIHVIL